MITYTLTDKQAELLKFTLLQALGSRDRRQLNTDEAGLVDLLQSVYTQEHNAAHYYDGESGQ